MIPAGRDVSTDAEFARSVRVGSAALLGIGVVLVVLSAFVIDGLRADPASGGFGTLQAPIGAVDIERAAWATEVRNAMDAFALDAFHQDANKRGGFRNSGRGWLMQSDGPGYSHSIADALAEFGLSVSSAPVGDDGGPVETLVHQCDDRFGVFVLSSVLPSEADQTWWDDHDCGLVPQWLVGTPLFFILGTDNA